MKAKPKKSKKRLTPEQQVKLWAPRHPRYFPVAGEERLGYFVEEAGEALAAAGKSIRWGLENYNPNTRKQPPETNREWLLRELADLKVAIALLESSL